MATHDANIENLRSATLGEQVRGSMIQLFEEDYNLVKRGITIGTAVSSASSSTTGYYDGNVYINSSTMDIWKLNGNVWTKQGNLKGISSITTTESTADGGNNVVTFTLTDGTTKSFNVKNGTKGNTGVSITGATDNGDGTFKLTLSDGSTTADIATVQGAKGEKGDKGDKGDAGATGRSVTSITSSDNGKNHILSANFSDGTSNVITTVKDGNDGEGSGNMRWETYESGQSEPTGIVNLARGLSDGTRTLTFNDVDSKANKNTSLSGYGITDAYTKTEVDDLLDDLASDWDSVTDKPFDTLGNEFKTKTVSGKKQLALADTVSTKLSNFDNDGNVINNASATTNNLYTQLEKIPSGNGTSGQVLTSNGTGGATWEDSQGNTDIISDEWNNTEAYVENDYCIYNNTLWKCLANNTGQTPTEGTYWSASNVGDELSALSNTLVFKRKQITVDTNGSGAFHISTYFNNAKRDNIITIFITTSITQPEVNYYIVRIGGGWYKVINSDTNTTVKNASGIALTIIYYDVSIVDDN